LKQISGWRVYLGDLDRDTINKSLPNAMNALISVRFAKATRRKTGWFWSLSATAALLFICCAVWTLISSSDPWRSPQPAGQLQADARTVIAALNYLLDRDDESAWPAATSGSSPGIFPVQPAPTASFCCLSNHAELLCEPITNQPARS